MEITLKVNLWKHKPDKDGECPLSISIRGGGDERYYSPGIKVHPDYWNGSAVMRGYPNYDILNNRITGLVKDTERAILIRQSAGEQLTIDQVKAMLRPDGKTGNFIAFYRTYVDNLVSTGKKAKGTIAVWETEYEQFKAYKGDRLPFGTVTADLLDDYHQHLATYDLGEGKHYAATTIHKKLKKLLQITRSAVKKGLIPAAQVEGFEMVKYVAPETDYLTLSNTQDLSDRLYRGEFDHSPTLRLVVTFFLVECYAGIRFGDWHRFEVEKLMHKQNFKVRTAKNKKPVYLDLTVFTSLAKVLDYIQANGLRFDLTEKTTNQTLKAVGILLGLRFPLSTHDGRRTFGTLLGELGYSTRFIAEAMGISPKTAETYIKITKQTMNVEMERIGGF